MQLFSLIAKIIALILNKSEKAVEVVGIAVDVTHDWASLAKRESDTAIAEITFEQDKRFAALEAARKA